MSELWVTPHGFRWGPLLVERTTSGDRAGWVLTVFGRTEYAIVRASPKGFNLSAEVHRYPEEPS